MEILKPYRKQIDDLDDRIVDLLADRTKIVHEVGNLKFKENISSVLQDRIDAVKERVARRAGLKNLDPDFVKQIYTVIIDYSCGVEDKIKDELSGK